MERFLSEHFMASHPANSKPAIKDVHPDTIPQKIEINRTPHDRPIFVRTQEKLKEISNSIITPDGNSQPTDSTMDSFGVVDVIMSAHGQEIPPPGSTQAAAEALR